MRADLSLDWPTWSQSAYRSWSIGEPQAEPPELIVELAFRLQHLVGVPDHMRVVDALLTRRVRSSARSASSGPPRPSSRSSSRRPRTPTSALEIAYQGSLRLEDALLEDPSKLDEQIAGVARWVASALVRLADLRLPFRPPEEDNQRA